MSDTLTTETPTAAPKRRRWVTPIAIVIALFIGLGVGAVAAGSTPVEKTEEYQSLAAELEQVKTDWSEAETTLAEREAAVETAEADAAAIIADAEAQAAATVEEADAQLATVEAKVEELDANNIEPGWYLVGSEISPGSYRAASDVSGRLCYVAQTQISNDDIVNNMVTDTGRPTFQVQNVEGTQVEIDSDCPAFQKIG